MMLYRWQGEARNFGDELNTILWPALLPDFFDHDPSVRFLGIGSILDRRHDRPGIKIVAGSGYGGYEALPRLDADWIIHWVRGPRTANLLGLPEALAVGDPAMLVPCLGIRPAPDARDIGFMPHFESAAYGHWRQVAAMVGVRLIDPRGDPEAVLAAICQCRLILSEALHGVIVADALRIPWIAILPMVPTHRPKWHDWADSMDLTLRFQHLPCSSLGEWAQASTLSSLHAGRVLIRRHALRLNAWKTEHWAERAAEALHKAAGAPSSLTLDATRDHTIERMMGLVETLRRRPLGGTSFTVRHGHALDTCAAVTIPRTTVA